MLARLASRSRQKQVGDESSALSPSRNCAKGVGPHEALEASSIPENATTYRTYPGPLYEFSYRSLPPPKPGTTRIAPTNSDGTSTEPGLNPALRPV